MSGFAVIFERSNTPVDPGVLERVMGRLNHRGPDGRDCWISGPIAMGHWHFWTTPEENGERQPLQFPNLLFTIVMDGRLDNRSDLINRLNLDTSEASHLSDAALILQAYARWGKDCFKDLIGEFAIVIWDQQAGELICARDALGDRSLFFAIHGKRIVIASEPWAVAGGLDKKVVLDDRAVAYHFAFQIPEDGQTLFKGIFELMPAHWMKINAETDYRQVYWEPLFTRRDRKRSEADYVEEFRMLLEESVLCRLRSISPPAVMMSGGLDSTSVACLAARMIAPEILTTVSYVFDEFPDCDERQYINAVRDQYNTHSLQIPCDDLWPYKNSENWPVNPNWPHANPYRLILERTYARASDVGLKVMLTGMYGDNLYLGSDDFLADLLFDGHFGQTKCEMQYFIKENGVKKLLKSRAVRRIIKRLLLETLGDNFFRRKYTAPEWLTRFSAEYLDIHLPKPSLDRQAEVISLNLAAGNSSEFYNTNRYSLELRVPYRDRRLVEFSLSLPTYFFYSQGEKKHILRESMNGVVPECIRSRKNKTNLLSLYNFGLASEKKSLSECFSAKDASWGKYVKSELLVDEWQRVITQSNDGPRAVVTPLCFFFDLWYKSHAFIRN